MKEGVQNMKFELNVIMQAYIICYRILKKVNGVKRKTLIYTCILISIIWCNMLEYTVHDIKLHLSMLQS